MLDDILFVAADACRNSGNKSSSSVDKFPLDNCSGKLGLVTMIEPWRIPVKRLALVLTLAAFFMVAARPQSQGRPFPAVTDAMLQNPDPGDWLQWRRTQNSWGYSPLNQITKANVSKLKMIWTRAMGPGIQEAVPLAYRGILYPPNPSDLVQAINGTTGDLLWEYQRQLPEDVTKIFPVPSINRNIAIYGNHIIDTSADDFVYALDAQTGKLTGKIALSIIARTRRRRLQGR